MIIAVTPGDPDGIGPEVAWKAIQALARQPDREGKPFLLCVGAREPFEKLGAPVQEISLEGLSNGRLKVPQRPEPQVWLLPAPKTVPKTRGKSKKPLLLQGYQSGWSIEAATRLVQRGVVSGLATGPISKDRLQRGGYPYPGHTEFLAALCKTRKVTMMLANETLRISLVTTHLALKDVPRALTRSVLRQCIIHTVDHLQRWWGIKKPRVAIAALNPHAGESGLFGKEELRVIQPELKALRAGSRARFELIGPLPSDTLFAKHVLAKPEDRYDAVVCMYHDQGLIPVKLLDFPNTVNITLGLPIIRTSVDHGVGFDIAGKNLADPSSLLSAIRLATRLAQHKDRSI